MNQRTVIALFVAAALLAGGGAAFFVFGAPAALNVAAQPRARCLDPEPQGAGVHAGMVWVPPGDFEMGDKVYPEEGPITKAHVAGFWMDKHEVTNGEFAQFVHATGYVTVAERPVDSRLHAGLPSDMLQPGAMVFFMPKSVDGMENISQWWRYVPGASWRHPGGPKTTLAGRENYPVVEVAYEDVMAYAHWKGRQIPREAEWEWAARGGNPKAGLDHDQPNNANTWQGIFPVLNSGDDGFVGLAPEGCYPPNKLGLYDVIGNVWEWTSDRYTDTHDPMPTSPDSPAAMMMNHGMSDPSDRYVIKGGSFLCAPNYCMRYRSGSREPQEADLAASHLGFRTILRGPKS